MEETYFYLYSNCRPCMCQTGCNCESPIYGQFTCECGKCDCEIVIERNGVHTGNIQ